MKKKKKKKKFKVKLQLRKIAGMVFCMLFYFGKNENCDKSR